MSHDTQLNIGTTGDIIVTYDLTVGGAYPTTGKLPAGVTYVGSPPTPVSSANPFPVTAVISAALPTGANVIGGVTQSGTWNVTVNTALPTGGNTIGAVTQASGPWTVNVTQVGSSALTFGQAVMASSIPVVIASNQSAVPASQSGTWNVTVNAALPTGANTIGAVTQASGPWTVNATQIGGASLAFGQANMAGSIPVVIASNQAAFPVTQSSGPWTVNLTQLSGSALAIGQALMAGSLPVVMASDHSTLPVDVKRVNGTVVDTNSGTKSAGTMRVVLATDQPTLTLAFATVNLNADHALDPSTQPPKAVLSGVRFRTTQPTLTDGQVVAKQCSSRGAAIVTTGVDTFNVTVNAALPTGSNTIGNVTDTNLEVGLAAGTAPSKMVVTGMQHNTTLPAPTNAQTVAHQCDQVGALWVNPQGRVPTYSTEFSISFTQANATDLYALGGSSTKTIKLLRMAISGVATATGLASLQLIKRSSANSGGTPTQAGGVRNDSSNPGVTAVSNYYGTNPSTGTTVGTVRVARLLLVASGGTVVPDRVVWDFTLPGQQPITLRGTAEQICLNAFGVTLPAGNALDIWLDWSEDDS